MWFATDWTLPKTRKLEDIAMKEPKINRKTIEKGRASGVHSGSDRRGVLHVPLIPVLTWRLREPSHTNQDTKTMCAQERKGSFCPHILAT